MSKEYLIWDLPVRIFHWAFAITILSSWFTAEQGSEYIELHMQLGYVALGLILFRILWGIVGPKHARFSNFIPSPRSLLAYLKDIKKDKTTPGHNPLGALMVVLMIVLISAQAISGLFINDDVFSSGPYYGSVGKDIEKIMSFIHHNAFNFMIGAIFLHLLAIFFYWRVKKQNLVVPMITGKKTDKHANASDAIPHSSIILGIFVALSCAAFCLLVGCNKCTGT